MVTPWVIRNKMCFLVEPWLALAAGAVVLHPTGWPRSLCLQAEGGDPKAAPWFPSSPILSASGQPGEQP